jgi:hypothetical protein
MASQHQEVTLSTVPGCEVTRRGPRLNSTAKLATVTGNRPQASAHGPVPPSAARAPRSPAPAGLIAAKVGSGTLSIGYPGALAG